MKDRRVITAIDPFEDVKPEPARMQWMPIETCNKNQSVISCSWWKSHPHRPFIQEGYLHWDGNTWLKQSGGAWQDELTNPTHWMPLPSPPQPHNTKQPEE